MAGHDTGSVLAAVLEDGERVIKRLIDVRLADDTDDATHATQPLLSGTGFTEHFRRRCRRQEVILERDVNRYADSAGEPLAGHPENQVFRPVSDHDKLREQP